MSRVAKQLQVNGRTEKMLEQATALILLYFRNRHKKCLKEKADHESTINY